MLENLVLASATHWQALLSRLDRAEHAAALRRLDLVRQDGTVARCQMPPMSTLLRNARSEVWPFVAWHMRTGKVCSEHWPVSVQHRGRLRSRGFRPLRRWFRALRRIELANEREVASALSPPALAKAEARARAAEAELLAMLDLERAEAAAEVDGRSGSATSKTGGKARGGTSSRSGQGRP